MRHQGELLGALSVSKRRGEALTPIEEKLVDDLAHQAGLVLKNVGLSSRPAGAARGAARLAAAIGERPGRGAAPPGAQPP